MLIMFVGCAGPFISAKLDGSVQFVTNDIGQSVWRALGTRDGGEVISEF